MQLAETSNVNEKTTECLDPVGAQNDVFPESEDETTFVDLVDYLHSVRSYCRRTIITIFLRGLRS